MNVEPGSMQPSTDFGRPESGFRRRLYDVIFGIDTKAGRGFDVALITIIVISVLAVMLDSVEGVHDSFGHWFDVGEWVFTIIFTVEYVARLCCVQQRRRYAGSFFGIVDVLAVLPSYLELILPGVNSLVDVRVLRLLRVFRVLRLGKFVAEFGSLGRALSASKHKIFVFLFFVVIVVLVMGTLMYVIEGRDNGFTSIPMSVYWAITTMTTVGFGDITPSTDVGRFIAAMMMLLGWGTLAVPTGIVGAEFTADRLSQRHDRGETRTCVDCDHKESDREANFCRKCGTAFEASVDGHGTA
ncbi:MAG: voltage-gated potassium channel [Hyphomicrobiaceae bacterium]|jgi:voltage-gated potassium channel